MFFKMQTKKEIYIFAHEWQKDKPQSYLLGEIMTLPKDLDLPTPTFNTSSASPEIIRIAGEIAGILFKLDKLDVMLVMALVKHAMDFIHKQ